MNAHSLSEVLSRPDLWRGGHMSGAGANPALPAVSSGFPELDAELPGGGWPRGALTELLCDGCGHGEMALLLPGLQRLCADDGWLLVIAPPYGPQAQALSAAGIALQRLLVVLPPAGMSSTPSTPSTRQRENDALWAAQQALSSKAPAAVVCWSATQDARAVQRLQVAAAAGHSATFLFRPWRVAGSASAAPLRLGLAGGEGNKEEGRLAVRLLKRRGPPLADPLHLAVSRPAPWHSVSHASPASSLARRPSSPASARRAAAAAHALFG